MRLKITAGISAPLLICGLATVLAGCPTGTAQEPNPNPPKIVSVYAVDFSQSLPRVALFDATDSRVSATAPASYGSVSVEVDQPLTGSSIANTETLNAATTCAPLAGNTAIQVVDVTGSASIPAASVIPSSVCYNPSTVIGSNPHIDIILGRNQTATSVFTCQTFTPFTKNAFTASFAPDHTYQIKIDPAQVVGSNSKAMTSLPTGTGWSSAGFTFKTSDIEVLAASYINANDGFTHFLVKPSKGFERNLDVDANFLMPPTSDPFMITLSDVVNSDNGSVLIAGDSQGSCHSQSGKDSDGNDDAGQSDCDAIAAGLICIDLSTPTQFDPGGSGATQLAKEIGECHKPGLTVTRKKGGTVFPVNFDAASGGDSRIIAITPKGTWEPDTEYVVTVDPTVGSGITGTGIGASAGTFSFKADHASLGVIATSPLSNATAVSFRSQLFIDYQAPIDPATATPANVRLYGADGTTVIPAAVDLDSGNQEVVITPDALLSPSTKYTVKIDNLKVAAAPVELAGQALASYSNTFTTAAFGISKVYDYLSENVDIFHPLTNCYKTTGVCGGTAAATLDHSATVPGSFLMNNRLAVQFNATPTGVNTDTLQLIDAATNAKVPIIITPVTDATHRRSFIIAIDSAQAAVKPNSKYLVKAFPAITGNGKNLSAEGCTGTGDACADIKSFNTAPLVPTIILDIVKETRAGRSTTAFRTNPDATRLGIFDVTFNYPVDATTLDLPTSATDFAKPIKLFKVNADGSSTQKGVTCAIGNAQFASTAVPTAVKCQATETPDANAAYQVVVAFANPLKPIATFQSGSFAVPNDPNSNQGGTIKYDQTAGQFTGSRTLSIRTACPPAT